MKAKPIQLEAVVEFPKILKQRLGGRIAIGRFLLQQSSKDLGPTRADSWTNFADLRQLSGLDLAIEFLPVRSFKKKFSRQQLIENDSQRKQI